MPKVATPITDTWLKTAKPESKLYDRTDAGGMFVRVQPTGAKSFYLRYTRPHTGKRNCLKLGNYPEMTLGKARSLREEAKTLLTEDLDPQLIWDEHRQQQTLAQLSTFESVAAEWFRVKNTAVVPSYSKEIWQSFEKHLFPEFGKVPIASLTATRVISVLKPIGADGRLETVKRLCQRINEVMTFALNTGLVSQNPLAGIWQSFPKPTKKHMPALKPEQLPELMTALTTASINQQTRILIEWQLHTMVRPGEAVRARWDEIDTELNTWTIPLEKMKKRREHVVPLTEQALAILELMKPLSRRREYIFPGYKNPRSHMNAATTNVALKRMGFKGELVAHGLRAVASTTLNEQGFDPEVIEICLSHVDADSVRRAYNRGQYLERRRKVMTWWSNHVERAATGNMSMAGKRGLKIASPIG